MNQRHGRRAFDTLVQLAQSRQEAALRQLAALLTQCRSDQERLALLDGYALDYRARLAQLSRQGAPAAALANFRNFLDQLERVRTQQYASLAQSRSRADTSRANWQDALRELRSFQTLKERGERAARAREARRERSREDEIASNHAAASAAGK